MTFHTAQVNPPIPVRSMDWAAWIDGREENGPTGRGATMAEAMQDLFDNMDPEELESLR